MANGYQPELWRDLYVMLGTSAGALIGLLFVVTSLHLDEIMNDTLYRIRARNNIYYLSTMVGEAGLILLPQPIAVLGAELIVVTLLLMFFHLRNLYVFHYRNRERGKRAGFLPSNAIRYIVSDLIGIIGAVCLLERFTWGLYIFSASYFLFLVAVILNAWTIMIGVGRIDTMKAP